MAKLTMPAEAAAGLSVRERVLLFCAASATDWQHTVITGENVTGMVVKGSITRGSRGRDHIDGPRARHASGDVVGLIAGRR
jgi:hypothetical protein